MANLWLRLWHDMPTDPKWRTVARLSGQPIALVISVYMFLLVDASRSVTRGHADVTAEDLASALDVTEHDIEAVLGAMEGRVIVNGALSGWEKRQPKREDFGDHDTGAKSARERKRGERERKKAAQELAEKEAFEDSVTLRHAASRNVPPDKDKDKDKDKDSSSLRSELACAQTPGQVCMAMKAAGIADVNPGHAGLAMLLEAGAQLQEFVGAAEQAAKKQKGFGYALAIVQGDREKAAQSAKQIHRGEMPAAETEYQRSMRERMAEAAPEFARQNPASESMDASEYFRSIDPIRVIDVKALEMPR